tara:strand:- start:3063 stop:4205 length:1143 start_codon:yes stop_codon:yes gene_type:complete
MPLFIKIKKLIKKISPQLEKLLIKLRDNNKIFRSIRISFFISPSKNIHGKKIVKSEKGLLLDLSTDNFVSYNFRPKKAKDFTIDSETYDNSSTAIIIQGSIYGIEKFVEETLLIYTKLFKNVRIILSTWKNDGNINFLEKFKEYQNIKIIINNEIKTNHNVDLQITSTNSALAYAKENNIEYCAKTRTDCRIYKKNSLFFLKNLLKIYPVNKEYNFLNNRIISCSVDTRKYRVYGLSDIFLFSSTNNLRKYFDETKFEDSLKKMNLKNHPSLKNDTAIINEIFLCARYLHNNNIELKWTLEEWWKKCSQLFCIVDANSLDFFWYKYQWKYEQRFNNNYTSHFEQSIQFSDWINLYVNSNHKFRIDLKEKWTIKDGLFEQL